MDQIEPERGLQPLWDEEKYDRYALSYVLFLRETPGVQDEQSTRVRYTLEIQSRSATSKGRRGAERT